MLLQIALLYLSFRLKHFACDYIFQTGWMATKKGDNNVEGYKALLAHAGVHAFGTLIVTLFFAPNLWWLSIVDLFVHSLIDWAKSNITKAKKWQSDEKKYWLAYGLDQEAHHLSHFAYMILIVLSLSQNGNFL